uniref:Uncharacterized protein n=1 Tax=Anguilla anguilla TaxID=7936 RepID=A0A0E9T0L0_ANGAN
MCTRTRARTHTHPPSQTSLLVQSQLALYPVPSLGVCQRPGLASFSHDSRVDCQ